jgi:hypothetical protein
MASSLNKRKYADEEAEDFSGVEEATTVAAATMMTFEEEPLW